MEYFVNPFSEDEEEDDTNAKESNESSEAEYTFQGYQVEFSEKVMLTPLMTNSGKQ